MELENKLMDALIYGKVKQVERVFEEIYNKYYKLVYFYIKQKINNKQDIEELTNDVFVSFYNSLNRKKTIEDIKAYLVIIQKNKVADYYKKHREEDIELDDNMVIKEEKDNCQDILDVIKEKLDEFEYVIFIKHVLLDETFQEIAVTYNKKANTIKSKYRRLLKKIRNIKL